jgi:hypothetical protein
MLVDPVVERMAKLFSITQKKRLDKPHFGQKKTIRKPRFFIGIYTEKTETFQLSLRLECFRKKKFLFINWLNGGKGSTTMCAI